MIESKQVAAKVPTVRPLSEPPSGLFWGLVAASVLALLVSKFFGVQGPYLPFIQQALDPTLYGQDYFVQHSTMPRVTVFFDLIRWLRLDLGNDLVGLAWHALWSGISAIFVVLILRDHLEVTDARWLALLLLLLVFADYKLLPQQKSAWLTHQTGTPTQIALALRFAALYFVLSRRHLLAALMVAIGMAFTVKTMWPMWLVAAAVALGDRESRPWSLLAYLGALAYPLWSIFHGPGGGTPTDALFATELALQLYPREDVPLRVEPYALVLFALSFPVYLYVLRGVEDARQRRVWLTVAAVTAAIFVGGIAYTAGGYRVYPNPMLVALSPVRAAEVYNFAFVALVGLATVRSQSLDALQKAGVLAALAVLSVVPDRIVWPLLSAILLGLGLIGPLLVPTVRQWARSAGAGPRQPALQYLLLAFFTIASLYLVTAKDYRPEQWPAFRTWTVNTTRDAALLRLASELRQSVPDARYVFVREKRAGVYDVDTRLNALARKSGLAGDPYWLIDVPDRLRAQVERNALADRLAASLSEPEAVVPPDTRSMLERLDARVVLPAGLETALPGWREERRVEGWVVVRPPDTAATAVIREGGVDDGA